MFERKDLNRIFVRARQLRSRNAHTKFSEGYIVARARRLTSLVLNFLHKMRGENRQVIGMTRSLHVRAFRLALASRRFPFRAAGISTNVHSRFWLAMSRSLLYAAATGWQPVQWVQSIVRRLNSNGGDELTNLPLVSSLCGICIMLLLHMLRIR